MRTIKKRWRICSLITLPLFVLVCCSQHNGLLHSQASETEPATKQTKDDAQNSLQGDKQMLSQFNSWIGTWRGVGQVKRGSTRGSWFETADWQWQFKKGRASLLYKIKDSKLFQSAELKFDQKTKQYILTTQIDKEQKRNYTGQMVKKQLVLESKPKDGEQVYRISMSLLNPKRFVALHQKRHKSSKFWNRIAEVGYTRKGTSLARAGAGQPECIVTGGTGTIIVEHQGKTYYVCCSGCKQSFDDDPEATIAAYKEKVEKRKSESTE